LGAAIGRPLLFGGRQAETAGTERGIEQPFAEGYVGAPLTPDLDPA
jgi:hypothetical protein